MFIRAKKVKGHQYYYLVENSRNSGKHRQRIVDYLGRANVAIATLENLKLEASLRQRLVARIRELEARH